MAQLALKGGFYQARSIIANAQRCVNLYPEKNSEDSPTPFTMYQTPGLKRLREGGSANGPAVGPWRGLYEASNGVGFGVVGNRVYSINEAWSFTLRATITTNTSNPVSMMDNGTDLVIVDGSTTARVITLADYSTDLLTAADNYLGADRVDYIDTFLVFNQPDTRNVYCTESNSLTIDPLAIAAKAGAPDKLATLIAMHRELWLLGGQRSTEVWFNVGASPFPFQITSGVFIEQGIIAKYSLAKNDLMVFWLGRNKDGQATVFMGTSYTAKRISTPAIAQELSRYSRLDDAIGMIYVQQDHVFYILTFPTANKTWVYDVSEGLWHERCWTDTNGNENRIRPACMTRLYGSVVAGDHSNGNFYEVSLDTFVDEVDDTSSPIVRRRGFQHIVVEGDQVSHNLFRAHMQTGEAAQDVDSAPVFLRWSDDAGRSWGNPIGQSMGLIGEYLTQPQWRQLGLARDRVFELFWSAPVDTALNGAWVDPTPAQTTNSSGGRIGR